MIKYSSVLVKYNRCICIVLPSTLLKTKSSAILNCKINRYEFQTLANPIKNSHHKIFINSKVRSKLKLNESDIVIIEIEKCIHTRDKMRIPKDILSSLKSNIKAYNTFKFLPVIKRKKYIEWIEQAKHITERGNRIEVTIHRLLST